MEFLRLLHYGLFHSAQGKLNEHGDPGEPVVGVWNARSGPPEMRENTNSEMLMFCGAKIW